MKKLTTPILSLGLAALTSALALVAPNPIFAATYTWTGQGFLGNQDFLWSNPFNWQGVAAPSAGETGVVLVFPDGNVPRVTTNDIAGLVVSSLQLQGADYVVQGKPFGNELTLFGTSLLGFTLGANGNGCLIASSCSLVLSNSGGINVPAGNTLTVAARIGGSGGFTKYGPGKLLLQAGVPNTFAGGTLVFDGTLELNQAEFFPVITPLVALPGPVVVGGENFDYSPVIQLLRNGQIADHAPVTVHENGKLLLNTHDDAIGSLTLRGGFVNTGAGVLSVNPGRLILNGNVTNRNTLLKNFATVSGRLDLGPFTRVFNIETNSDLSINASISGSPILNSGLTKIGGGLLRLYGATNTYTGPTSIEEGAIRLVGSTPLLGSTNAGTSVANTGQLQLENHGAGAESLTLHGGGIMPIYYEGSNTWAGPIELNGDCRMRGRFDSGAETDELICSGPIVGPGGLRKSSHSVLRLSGAAPNTFTGGLFAEEGLLFLNKAPGVSALNGPLVVGREDQMNFGSLLVVRSPHQIPNQLPVAVLNSGTLNIEAAAPETLTNIELAGGSIASESGALFLSGHLTNRVGLQSSAIYGQVMLSANPHVFHGDPGSVLDVHGILDGAGGLIKTGPNSTLALLNTNNYAGETVIKEGILNLRQQGRPGSTVAGTVVESLAVLGLLSQSVTNESLTLLSTDGNPAGLYNSGVVRWKGPITCEGVAGITVSSPSHLTLDGPISGNGGLRYSGEYSHTDDGTLVLEGAGNNTFFGPLVIDAGTLVLRKNGRALAGDLVVGMSAPNVPPALVQCEAAGQFTPATGPALETRLVTVHHAGHLDLNGFDQQIANLQLVDGLVTTGAGQLVLDGDIVVADGPNETSYIQGSLHLNSPTPSIHDWVVGEQAALWLTANVSETGDGQIFKKGAGSLLLIGDNTFHSYLTVSAGSLYAGGTNPFGDTSHPTLVEAGATLATALTVCGETLHLSGDGFHQAGALQVVGTNAFTAPIFLTGETMVQLEPNAVATVTGIISGNGSLHKTGPGRLRLGGMENNTFSGATVVREGILELAKTNALAIPHGLDITDRFSDDLRLVRWLGSDQVADGSDVTLDHAALANLNGFNETIGSLSGGGQFALGAGSLTTGANDASTGYVGVLTGAGSLAKTGAGTFSLHGDNSYTGLTTVHEGVLLVFGQQSQSDISLLTEGELGGTGRVGDIDALNGHVAPGASPGILASGNFATWSPANLMRIEINGPLPGEDYDQLDVQGSILLMGGGLQVSMNTIGAVSNRYVIVHNDGVDPVTGTFTGLAEGATVMAGQVSFSLTYQGGDGNDIELIQQTAGAGPKMVGIQKLGTGAMQFTALGLPDTLYRIEAAPNLVPPIEWRFIGTAQTDTEGQFTFVDPDAPQYPSRYYRFLLP